MKAVADIVDRPRIRAGRCLSTLDSNDSNVDLAATDGDVAQDRGQDDASSREQELRGICRRGVPAHEHGGMICAMRRCFHACCFIAYAEER